MRILFIVHNLGSGGAERVLTTIAGAWAERGCDVRIATYDTRRPFYTLHPCVERISLDIAQPSRGRLSQLFNFRRRVRAVRRLIESERSNVVISFQDIVNIETLLAARGLAVPVIISERSVPDANLPGRGKHWLYHRVMPRAARIVVQTSGVLSYLRPPARAKGVVIPNPVSPPVTWANRETREDSFQTVIAMGRLAHAKGHDQLLDAWASLVARRPDWSLKIVGEGPLRSELEKRRDALGLARRVFFPGSVRNVSEVFRRSDFFVMSSRFEGFPNALCEAMAHGLAVVSTDCRHGPREIIHDGVDGLLVPPHDPAALAAALERLMDDEVLRARLGRAATAIVERFSLGRVMDQWDDVVEEATGRRPALSAPAARRAA